MALFQETRKRYESYRAAVLNEASCRLRRKFALPDLWLGPLDWEALGARSNTWVPIPGKDGNFDWEQEVKHLACKLARFEVAVWHGDTLCGLGLGKPSPRKTIMRIHLIEGKPGSHPLKGKIALCVAATAGLYGQAVGSKELRIIRPLPGAMMAYRRLNFKLPPGYNYPADPDAVDNSLEPPYCVKAFPARRG